MKSATDPLVGWSPIRVGWRGGQPRVDWCYTDGVPFTDPFFDQTVEACFRQPFRLLFRRETGVEEVGRFVADHPGLPAAGFVFHMSRCGSTLVAQMLAAGPEHLVLSEAGPLDSVLRSPHPERDRWLEWMLGALGQPRDDRQRRLYVKFDAWSVLELPLVRRTFPDVPWLFLYRDPVEVLVSHTRRPGAHMIPGVLPPELFPGPPAGTLVEYGARVLARICEAALEFADDPLATFVEYGQLPDVVVRDLARAWSFPVDREALLAVARSDAKNPALPFTDDRAAKQTSASPEVREAAERWLYPLYDRLEEARAPR